MGIWADAYPPISLILAYSPTASADRPLSLSSIVQEMLHGKDIVPMERDRLIDTLIHLITDKERLR